MTKYQNAFGGGLRNKRGWQSVEATRIRPRIKRPPIAPSNGTKKTYR
jgi:hypothetical protein